MSRAFITAGLATLLGASAALAPRPAAAQDFTIGILGAAVPQFPGSNDYEGRVFPSFRFEGERISVTSRGPGFAVDFIPGPALNAGPLVLYDFGRDPSDIDDEFVASLPEIDETIEVGGYIEVLRPFPGLPSGVFAGGGLEVRTGVDGGHDGTLIIPKAGIRSIRDGRILSADLAFTFTDDNYADTFFSTPGFEAGGGLQDIVLTLFGSVPITENVSLQGVLGLNFYQGDAADSPITEEDGDVFFGFGATYSF